MKTARWAAAGVAVVIALLVAVLGTRDAAGTREAKSELLGRPAPVVEGRTLEGSPIALTDFRGRYLLVNFFATWCVPCRKEQPDLVRFERRHRAAGDAALVTIVFDDDLGAVRRFMADNGGTWPVLQSRRAAVDFGVRGVPESYLIDRQGFVVAKLVGGVEHEFLERLLAEAKEGA